ncbi:hypothetical protein V6N11_038540 [Hibiscus sabdariffa]|uniref:Uncharacterized protein n=1 Tax=Hibiscus sabdariffa TaxID=183260 RepID=A0ABR2SKK2_9ROSI
MCVASFVFDSLFGSVLISSTLLQQCLMLLAILLRSKSTGSSATSQFFPLHVQSTPTAEVPPTTLHDPVNLRQQSPATTTAPVANPDVTASPIIPYAESGLGDLPMVENLHERDCDPEPAVTTASDEIDMHHDAHDTTGVDRSTNACSSSTCNQHEVQKWEKQSEC